MKILNIKGGKQWLMTGVVASLLLCSCGDLDIVPEGKSTLEKTSELELQVRNIRSTKSMLRMDMHIPKM